jgi:quercetin dioxygenase-like cupin family protein
MNVLRAAETTYIDTPGNNATAGIATASRGATEVSVIRQRQQPGGGNPPHTHDREEVMLVTEGIVDVRIGDETVQLHAGDTLVVPAQTVHQLANAGDTEAAWLLIAPAGVGFFHANGERADPVWAR